MFSDAFEKEGIGIIKYKDPELKSIKVNDLIGFRPGAEYEFIVQGKKECIEYQLIKLQSNMNIKETKKSIIQAGHKAVEELIKVAKEAIVDSDDDISADRLKNAAATKKLAIFDAFEILIEYKQKKIY